MTNILQGKCGNYGNCSLADEEVLIDVPDWANSPLVCQECGHELNLPNKKGIIISRKLINLLGLIFIVLVCLYIGWNYVTENSEKKEKKNTQSEFSACSPKLMEGKKSIFQRVLIKPNTHKALEAGGMANQKIMPFSRYYVYQRQLINGEEWLQIGPNTRCEKVGWVKEKATIEWKQQLSLTFTNSASKDRGHVYFFKEKKGLQNFIKDPSSRSGIIAEETEYYVDPESNFYLVPILDYSEEGGVNLLKVATATLDPGETDSAKGIVPKESTIVFVIDTTISMKPYIDQLRKAVTDVYSRFQISLLREHVKFGLIGFRSNIRKTPALNYVTKIFVDPSNPQQEQEFINIITKVNEASVPSHQRFNEDSYAGVLAAINQIQWDKFLGRNIILITDAGAIEGDEKLDDGTSDSAAEDFTGEIIQQLAQTKGINLYTLHMKTPYGHENHNSAKSQYVKLTKNSVTNNSLYYDQKVQRGQTDLFGDSLQCIIQSWATMILDLHGNNNSYQGQELIVQRCPQSSLEAINPRFAKQKQKLRSDQLLLGNALRLKYMGKKEGTQIPNVVEGWINDKTSVTSSQKVQINVLFSRSELNSLAEKVSVIIKSDENSQNNLDESQAQQFFKHLKQEASLRVRDPNLSGSKTIGELLNLEELLDLPYKSQITGLSEDTWREWGPSQRETLRNTLRGKLNSYKEIDSDVSAWHDITDDADSGDYVTLIPIDLFP